jgi:hypothetical protein
MMPGPGQDISLRTGQREMSRLVWALAISVAVHFLFFGVYQYGGKMGLLKLIPDWLERMRLVQKLLHPTPTRPPENREIPLVFVDVNPATATPEPPKNAKYYSNKNSVAANPDADQNSNTPKINGSQPDVPKAEDTPRNPFDKLQPTFHPPEPKPQPAKPKSTVGDLAMAKPPQPAEKPQPEQSRPRTIAEALRRQHQLAGQQMKQAGGVNRQRLDPGFDVKATPFGDYDAAFIEAVQSHWYDLLDHISYNGYRRGKVELQFRLNYKGHVTDMQVVDENVGATLSLLCQQAVLDPSEGAGYGEWSRDMRLLVDKDYREFHFTFYY